MAGKEISDLTPTTEVAGNDLVEIVDISAGDSKSATLSQIAGPALSATPGSMVANTAMIADSNGKMESVSAAQLARLDVNAGAWSVGKALTVDSTGQVAGVSSAQFTALIYCA